MKFITALVAIALLFSCQKSSESNNSGNSGNGGNTGTGGQQGEPAKKTLKFTEILEQDLSAKDSMNWGNAESFKAPALREVEMVKLSYFFQENKLIKSTDISKQKGYCELSTTVPANKNGSEIVLKGNEKLFRFADFRSEKTEINNLDYKYDAMFKLTFRSVDMHQVELACFNILDLAEMKSTIDSKFKFTKHEEKETK